MGSVVSSSTKSSISSVVSKITSKIIFNNSSNAPTPIYKAGVASLLANTSHLRILNIGNSTTFGANGTGAQTKPNEYKQAAASMAAFVTRANDDSFFGFSTGGGQNGSRLLADDRIVNSGAVLSSTGCLGGIACRIATAGNSFTFTPNSVCNTFRVYWWYNGSVAVSIQATGGTAFATTLTSGSGTQFGTTDIRYTEVTAASLTAGNAVTVSKTGGAGNFEVIGIEAWDSTTKRMVFTNAGHWGSTSTQWAQSSGAGRLPSDFLSKMPAGYYQLAIIKAGINDCGPPPTQNIPVATFKANIQTVINACKASGLDVILETDNPAYAAGDYLMGPYIAALKELAASNNLNLVNSYENVFINYTNANAKGWMIDGLHPSVSGYAQMAVPLVSLLKTQGGL